MAVRVYFMRVTQMGRSRAEGVSKIIPLQVNGATLTGYQVRRELAKSLVSNYSAPSEWGD
jgi:hypothetical protein